MLVIQTAFAQEFTPIAGLLRPLPNAQGDAERSWRFARGAIAGRECCLIQTGIGGHAARRAISEALGVFPRPQIVISIGFAGALDGQLRCGDLLHIKNVRSESGEPSELCAALNHLAPSHLEKYSAAHLLSVERPVLTVEGKRRLAQDTGSALCDMETHAVAEVVCAHDLPWLGARVVSDTAQETLKDWIVELPALVEQRKWVPFCRQLVTHPQDLPGLLRLGFRMHALQRELAKLTAELISTVSDPKR